MSIRLQIKRKGADEALRALAGNVAEEMVQELRNFGARWERTVKLGFAGGGKSVRGGPRLHARTGALRRSARFRVLPAQRAVILSVGGKDAPYAAIQEYGGTIRPTRKKWLTVPTSNALTGAGALSGRFRIRPAGTRHSRRGGTRRVYTTDMGETFIFKGRNGRLYIGLKRKGKKLFDPKRDTIYALKKRVDIRPRLGAWDAARFDGKNGSLAIQGFENAAARGVAKS